MGFELYLGPLGTIKIEWPNNIKHPEFCLIPHQSISTCKYRSQRDVFLQQNLSCVQALQDLDLEAKVAQEQLFFFPLECLLCGIAYNFQMLLASPGI